MNYRWMRSERLNILEKWISREESISWIDVPEALREADLVTENYGSQCLLVDIWYLKRNYLSSSSRSDPDILVDASKLRFQIVLRCLIDLSIGRPCDLNAWRKDLPSDSCKCTNEFHICSEDAEKYLLDLDEETEEDCGLSSGKIRDLIKRIKRDPIFSIGYLLKEPTSFSVLRKQSLLQRQQILF